MRKQYDFFTRVQTPELAAESHCSRSIRSASMQQLFFRHLVVPQAMGMEVQMVESKGPVLPRTIQSFADVEDLISGPDEAVGQLQYMAQSLSSQRTLDGRVR
jgi:uroporphyrinogen decarboxylase